MEVINFSGMVADESIDCNPDGGRFIPINKLEELLDPLNWSTRNFHYTLFKNSYSDTVIAASLELVIETFLPDGERLSRSFIGACSFSLRALEPNQHFLATAKSECVKNAASDIGKYFGRGLNDELVPFIEKKEEKPKQKPDSKIMQQFLKAVEQKDEATITLLSNIYDIKND